MGVTLFDGQISTMSSSEIEEASIGVPSLLVIDIKHNLPEIYWQMELPNLWRWLQRRLWTFFENFTQF